MSVVIPYYIYNGVGALLDRLGMADSILVVSFVSTMVCYFALSVSSGSTQTRVRRGNGSFTSTAQIVKNFVFYFALSSVCTNFAYDRVVGALAVAI